MFCVWKQVLVLLLTIKKIIRVVFKLLKTTATIVSQSIKMKRSVKAQRLERP